MRANSPKRRSRSWKAGLADQLLCHPVPHLGETGVAHIAMRAPAIPDEARQGFDHLRRRVGIGVPEGAVENISGPSLASEAAAFLEHAPDPRRTLQMIRNGTRNSHQLLAPGVWASSQPIRRSPAGCSRSGE
jgi:hypothetical protein